MNAWMGKDRNLEHNPLQTFFQLEAHKAYILPSWLLTRHSLQSERYNYVSQHKLLDNNTSHLEIQLLINHDRLKQLRT